MTNFAKYYAKGDKRRKCFSKSRRSSSASLIDSLFKVGTSIYKAQQRESKRRQREYARQTASYSRLLEKQERDAIRQAKQHEMAIRRAERERAKAERELEKAQRLQARLEEQQRFEEEVSDIEEENDLWTNVHRFIEKIVTNDDAQELIAKCDYEQNNDLPNCLFEKDYPLEAEARKTAQMEANQKFDLAKIESVLGAKNTEFLAITFSWTEPTKRDVELELIAEAKERIKAFLPWKQSKLRKAYIEENLTSRYDERFKDWSQKRSEYLTKKKKCSDEIDTLKKQLAELAENKNNYITSRTSELFEKEIKKWENERNDYYNSLRNNVNELIDGDRNYVISAISSVVQDEELPMEYFVDFVYEEEKGKVMVDLDLPEIEDIPNRKIALTPSGKKSIRAKNQIDLKSDYASCVFGLAMYVAHLIFNVSLKIEEIEISGFTQRQGVNSTVPDDEYIFVVSFNRELFSSIDFNILTSYQVMNLFKHYFNMTKSCELKQIKLSNAYEKMESMVTANYQDYIAHLPKDSLSNNTNSQTPSNSQPSSPYNNVGDTPNETFDKAVQLVSQIYSYIDKLSKDARVNKHADNLNGVRITFTSGNFNGDGDTRTYRGKLYFCMMADLSRSLKKMQISLVPISPACYTFALMMSKIYMQMDVKFSMLSLIEQPYKDYCDMLKTMDNNMPVFDRYFMIGEILYDYETDISLYHKYMDLMKQHISIVRDSIQSDNVKIQLANAFSSFVNTLGSNPQVNDDKTNNYNLHNLDPLFEDAAKLIVQTQSGSTSLLQRKFATRI